MDRIRKDYPGQGSFVEPAAASSMLTRILRQLSDEDREFLISLIDKDPLTGAYNRRKFDTDVELVIAMADRTSRGTSLLMIDIDHFKAFNDRHGHQHGDAVLKQVTMAIEGCLRGYDKSHLYRYGGEEFVVLLPNVSRTDAFRIGERLRKGVATDSEVTVSIGISHYKEIAKSLEKLIRFADMALYEAKQSGRNRVLLADPDTASKSHMPS